MEEIWYNGSSTVGPKKRGKIKIMFLEGPLFKPSKNVKYAILIFWICLFDADFVNSGSVGSLR